MDNQYFQCLSVRDRFVSFQQKFTENKQKKVFLCYEKENVFTKGKARMRFAQNAASPKNSLIMATLKIVIAI